MPLEGPDEPISLPRAAELSGVSVPALRAAVLSGHLWTVKQRHDLATTRRHLHQYLVTVIGRVPGSPRTLPVDYQVPEAPYHTTE